MKRGVGRRRCTNAFLSPQSASRMLTNVITLHIKSSGRCDRLPVNRRWSSEMRSMTQPCLIFRDLTLGYSRHPAVHHLSGTVADRLADGGGRRQRLRQVDPDEGHRRRAEADGRRASSTRAARASPICRSNPSSTAPFRHASSISFRSASGRSAGCSAASPTRTARRSRRRCRRSASKGSRSGRSTRCRAASCSGRCSRACWCRTPRSSCSTSRSTRWTPRPSST